MSIYGHNIWKVCWLMIKCLPVIAAWKLTHPLILTAIVTLLNSMINTHLVYFLFCNKHMTKSNLGRKSLFGLHVWIVVYHLEKSLMDLKKEQGRNDGSHFECTVHKARKVLAISSRNKRDLLTLCLLRKQREKKMKVFGYLASSILFDMGWQPMECCLLLSGHPSSVKPLRKFLANSLRGMFSTCLYIQSR